MNYMHECDRLQSENARLRQEASMNELETRNLRAALRSKKCDKCGSCAVRCEPAPELPRLTQEEAQRIGREVHEDVAEVRAETEHIGNELDEHSRRKARGELPRKVEPGTALTVGARYRITATASWDGSPVHRVGDVLIGRAEKANGPGIARSRVEREWFASDEITGTYVTGLELVEEKDTKK